MKANVLSKLNIFKPMFKSNSVSPHRKKQQLPKLIQVKNFQITSDKFNKYLLLNTPSNNNYYDALILNHDNNKNSNSNNNTRNAQFENSFMRKSKHSSLRTLKKDLASVESNKLNSTIFKKSVLNTIDMYSSGEIYQLNKRNKSNTRSKCLFMKKQLDKKQRNIDNIMSHVLQLHRDEESNIKKSMAKLAIANMKHFLFHN